MSFKCIKLIQNCLLDQVTERKYLIGIYNTNDLTRNYLCILSHFSFSLHDTIFLISVFYKVLGKSVKAYSVFKHVIFFSSSGMS